MGRQLSESRVEERKARKGKVDEKVSQGKKKDMEEMDRKEVTQGGKVQ